MDKNKTVILGSGISGIGAVKLAQRKGLEIFLSDSKNIKSETKKLLSKLEVKYEESGHTENLIKDYKATVSLRQPRNHHDDWLDCIHSGELPLAHVEAGHRTATLCQLCNIGYELRRELDWDPKKERFAKDDEANQLIDRKRRKKWYRV